MDFVVAASTGTHLYRAEGLAKPTLLQTLPRPQPVRHCLASNCDGGLLAVLLQSGAVGIWDLREGGSAQTKAPGPTAWVPCEVAPQSGPITRCYFSPKGSFLVTWEPQGTIHRVEGKGESKGGAAGKSFGRAENLSAWGITRRPRYPTEFQIEISKDGKQKLGVNVDHLDGCSGLLVRRVDPGLVEGHNRAVRTSQPAMLVLPGDKILVVNNTPLSAGAKCMAEEIQRADVLKLTLQKGPAWALALPMARFFAPHISPLRWPPIQWSSDEAYAFRSVTDEIQVMDGRTMQQLWRLEVHSISQLAVSQRLCTSGTAPEACSACLAVFCPAASSCSPGMVRVFTSFGKKAMPALTKSFFSDCAWVSLKWDPVDGQDLLALVHSSDLTEDDLAFRTLHGQGGNSLYLLRPHEAAEPVAALSSSQEGAILDVQWSPACRNEARSIILLQGPQPALVSVLSYSSGGGGGQAVLRRVNLGRFGVRNCFTLDPCCRSFCLRVQSERGGGISNEADSADLFDVAVDGTILRRTGVAVVSRQKDQVLGPSVSAAEFSPDGRILMTNVQSEAGSELRFLGAADGQTLYRLKFEGISAVAWQPRPAGTFPAPDFPVPVGASDEGALSTAASLAVELRDRELFRRRLRKVQGKLRELERGRQKTAKAKSKPGKAAPQAPIAEAGQESEAELRAAVAALEAELAKPDEHFEQLVFEVSCLEGMRLLETLPGEFRDAARNFCREHCLDPQLAGPLAEQMEQQLQRGQNSQPKDKRRPGGGRGQKPAVIDLGDKDAVQRKVRALQKKLREIDKLKQMPESALELLQKEKILTEAQVRQECGHLERELDLLCRLPRLVFDVETDSGMRYIEFRDGDDCLDLAKRFCEEHDLDKELIQPLAAHMEAKLAADEEENYNS
eukprot:TRINITY_DN10362_c0_g1_i1.p1 TRINITY_DN10362_c0_g1~~TRINITY_DN10362_c0_g1_i1.p1  ORF type:complete len:901 (-),score=172.67 TRINITY_DN10362_c0_g1_i1:81-2783(-)